MKAVLAFARWEVIRWRSRKRTSMCASSTHTRTRVREAALSMYDADMKTNKLHAQHTHTLTCGLDLQVIEVAYALGGLAILVR